MVKNSVGLLSLVGTGFPYLIIARSRFMQQLVSGDNIELK